MKALLIFISILIIAFTAGALTQPYFKIHDTVSIPKNLPPAQFSSLLDSGKYTLIDIRTPEEFSAGHLAGALQNDFYQTAQFSKFLDQLDKNAEYLIYCRTGNRSSKALKIIQEKGFKNALDLAGGIVAWQQSGLPVILPTPP